ncbi:MAG TPA: hypothetical protein VNZ61_17565 [Roseomonas sp.]|nr:hypothetical protein [Roseomonas sp.]
MTARSIQAAIRFGLGGRPDQLVPEDAAAWLKGQLRQTEAKLPLPEGWDHQPTVAGGIRAWTEDRDSPARRGRISG